ncbi:acyltransferase family protein [Symbioplanes lichenis]|uniref:acyltransferase family protein n=1 Tax=Symbioplanes lichenis TaxID=1629072 RepID=UPI002739736D|nr:acyltransferase family protein [Actinoplanes lichenis]
MSLSAPTRPVAPSAPATAPHLGFRPDIEGLRALAVVLVVLSHAGIAGLEGGYVGVDVFFVISGFLITTLLVKELGKTGAISLAGFYARRATRLLPASTVVLVTTLVGAWFWLPVTRFHSIATDALFSTFYGINWRLAAEGTDYLNATSAPSPLQHLWSLAVEEQFYLVWPLLLLAVWAWRRGRSHVVPVIVVLSVVVVASLTVSVWLTSRSAPWAYFSAHTRAFELGIGALVAVGAGAFARTPKVLAAAATWTGLAAIGVAAVVFDEGTMFPGAAALLPVLGSAAVIAGGTPAARGSAVSLLRTWPFQQLGKLSYGWYLWHWPVLMIGPAALGVEPTTAVNLALAAGALGLAVASYHLVENPVRRHAWLKATSARGIGLGLVLSASAAALALVAAQFTPPLPTGPAAPDTAAALATAADPQARLTQLIATSAGKNLMPENLTPKLQDAGDDVPRIYADECHVDYEPDRQDRLCVYGDPAGARTVYLIGDSHAANWFPAVDAAARDAGWKLVAMTKAACPVPSVRTWNIPLKRPYAECSAWRDQVFDRIAADRPQLVVLASNDMDSGGLIDDAGARVPMSGKADDPLWAAGWQRSFDRLRTPGASLVLLQDTNWPRGEAPECAATNPENLTACNRPLNKSIVEPNRRKLVAAAARADGIRVVDPTPWLCTTTCPIVIGNTLVFKDNSHLTETYSKALAPLMGAALFK